LFVGVVWSMVSRNAIDGSIRQPLDHSSNVFLGAKRRTHFCIGVVSRAGSVGQREMVRRDLAGSLDSLTLGSTNQFQCSDGGQVRDMNMRAGEFGQDDVSRGHCVLSGPANSLQSQSS